MGGICVFDAHCDAIYRADLTGEGFRENGGHISIVKLKGFTSYAQFFACFSMKPPPGGPTMWEIFRRQAALFHREVEANREQMAFCTTGDDMARAWREKKVAAFLSVEGAELLECDVEKLHEAHRMGVRAVNLTWNYANALSGSNQEDVQRGLSARGLDFVREMNRLGMLVDVSHLSDAGFWDVAAVTVSPIIASHSNSRSRHFHPRNLTDGQFTAIMELQGVVGLNLCPKFLGDDPDLDAAIDHLEHFLALGGEDTVALGGDWDGVESLPRGVEDVGGWMALYRRLEELGYSQTLLDKLFYKNLARVVREVCIT